MATDSRSTRDWLEELLASGRIRIQHGPLLDEAPDRAPRAWRRGGRAARAGRAD